VGSVGPQCRMELGSINKGTTKCREGQCGRITTVFVCGGRGTGQWSKNNNVGFWVSNNVRECVNVQCRTVCEVQVCVGKQGKGNVALGYVEGNWDGHECVGNVQP